MSGKVLIILLVVASLLLSACSAEEMIAMTGGPAAGPSSSQVAPPTPTFPAAPIEIDGGQIGMEPGLPYVVGNDGQAHALPFYINDCLSTSAEQSWDGESHVTWCGGGPADEGMDILDAAALATLATPWPGDEEIIGVVWAGREAGKMVLKVIVIAGTAIAAQEAGAILQRGYHTDPTHDPATSTAAGIITAITSFWVTNGGPGGDPNRFRCFTLKLAGQAVRYMYWLSSNGGVSGDFAVWNVLTGEWTTAFGNKQAATLWNIPTAFQKVKGAKVEAGCDNFAPPSAPAAP